MQTEFFKKKLKNGLTILFEKRNLPVVAVSASVKWGCAYEAEKIKGISHFLEHLLFKGTKKRNQKEIAAEIERKGGELNGYTSEDVTSYWNRLPSRHFNTSLDIASDLILNPKFDPIEFEKEKQVIIEEIKMYHDNPLRHSMEKITELLYEKPFGMSGTGTVEIINSLSRQQVVELHNSMYASDGMILSVVGDADFEEICKLAEKTYPFTKRKAIAYAPIKKNSELVEKRDGLDQAHFVFGFHSPTAQQEERYEHEVACAYLFGGMSSRLFQEIREKRGLAYAVKGEINLGKNYGYTRIYVGTVADKIKMIKEIILKEIKAMGQAEQRDIEEVKEQLLGQWDIARENSIDVMNSLMLEESTTDAEDYYKFKERVSAVRLEDVRKLAKLKSFSTFSLIPRSDSTDNTKN